MIQTRWCTRTHVMGSCITGGYVGCSPLNNPSLPRGPPGFTTARTQSHHETHMVLLSSKTCTSPGTTAAAPRWLLLPPEAVVPGVDFPMCFGICVSSPPGSGDPHQTFAYLLEWHIDISDLKCGDALCAHFDRQKNCLLHLCTHWLNKSHCRTNIVMHIVPRNIYHLCVLILMWLWCLLI